MKRWDGKDYSENSKIDAFLAEIRGVCEKHGFSISHEDRHGSFEIEEYDEEDMQWLLGASNILNISRE
jgi:hypothetical protein